MMKDGESGDRYGFFTNDDDRFLNAGTNSLITVSYTHLDVYKRQIRIYYYLVNMIRWQTIVDIKIVIPLLHFLRRNTQRRNTAPQYNDISIKNRPQKTGYYSVCQDNK